MRLKRVFYERAIVPLTPSTAPHPPGRPGLCCVEQCQEALDAVALRSHRQVSPRNDNRESSGKFQIYHEAVGESHMTIHTAYFDEATKKAAKEYHYELERKLDDLYTVSPPCMFVAGHAGYGYWSRPARMDGQSKKDAVKDSIHDFPFYDATQNSMNASGPNQRGKYKSAYMKERFPIEQVEAMIEHLRTVPEGLCPEDMKQSLLQIDCFGGRINVNDFEQKDAALGQRDYVVKLQFQTYWTEEEKDELHLKWIRDFYHEGMYGKYEGVPDPAEHDMFQGCYYNYPDADLNDYRPE
eukprot:scaffold5331_cov58-Attheya_sp.AAC.2